MFIKLFGLIKAGSWLSGLIAVLLLLAPFQAQAVSCYFTLVKDSCWTDYEVTVTVQNADDNSNLLTLSVPKGKSWTRQSFSCQPNMKLMYLATFSPVFWQRDAGKVFMASNYLMLPASLQKGSTAWSLTSCFAKDYAAVPLPPNVLGNCQCNLKEIPPVPPEKTN